MNRALRPTGNPLAAKASPKMEDIAREAGVSLMTVSRALRADKPVSPATRARILAIVQRLGYVPDQLAGGLASRRSGFVSLLVPSLNNPHFAETAMGLKEVLEPQGLQVLLGHTSYDLTQEERLVETMLRRRPEAMVLTYDGHSTRTRKLLKDSGIPVIDLWDNPPRPVGHVVGFSNHDASRAMTEHLIERGYRRIGYLGESHDAETRGQRRREGFIAAMTAAGLSPARQVAFAPPPINMHQGGEAFAELMARWPNTEAVMCVSDPCAFGALSICQRRGWPVPQRMAIAGFGAFEISAACVPSLSTVLVSGREIGHKAGVLIMALLDGKSFPTGAARQRIQVSATALAREST